ncbi:MAG: hypothetical protein A4E57_03102 [Syntrophorhabdaceae bacterium PtaU1.Bin034]|nr:MAG: hypothetical protein A4E57_03102 [Syntrophorhabdaceae bacterium PtaU1.Bin034]
MFNTKFLPLFRFPLFCLTDGERVRSKIVCTTSAPCPILPHHSGIIPPSVAPGGNHWRRAAGSSTRLRTRGFSHVKRRVEEDRHKKECRFEQDKPVLFYHEGNGLTWLQFCAPVCSLVRRYNLLRYSRSPLRLADYRTETADCRMPGKCIGEDPADAPPQKRAAAG